MRNLPDDDLTALLLCLHEDVLSLPSPWSGYPSILDSVWLRSDGGSPVWWPTEREEYDLRPSQSAHQRRAVLAKRLRDQLPPDTDPLETPDDRARAVAVALAMVHGALVGGDTDVLLDEDEASAAAANRREIRELVAELRARADRSTGKANSGSD